MSLSYDKERLLRSFGSDCSFPPTPSPDVGAKHRLRGSLAAEINGGVSTVNTSQDSGSSTSKGQESHGDGDGNGLGDGDLSGRWAGRGVENGRREGSRAGSRTSGSRHRVTRLSVVAEEDEGKLPPARYHQPHTADVPWQAEDERRVRSGDGHPPLTNSTSAKRRPVIMNSMGEREWIRTGREQDHSREEDGEDGEEVLKPRGGPPPVPSPISPRAVRAGAASRASMETSVLLRTALARELDLRRSEHKDLMDALRKHGIINDPRPSSHTAESGLNLGQRARRPSCAELGGDGCCTRVGGVGTHEELSSAGTGSRETALPLDREAWLHVMSALEGALERRGRESDDDEEEELEEEEELRQRRLRRRERHGCPYSCHDKGNGLDEALESSENARRWCTSNSSLSVVASILPIYPD